MPHDQNGAGAEGSRRRWVTRAASLLGALVFLASTLGCGGRNAGSAPIPPPVDLTREQFMPRLSELMADPKIRLGEQNDYFIGPGDILGLSMVGRPDILGEDQRRDNRFMVTVTENPFITLPQIGAIKVHGKTAEQLQNDLKTAYNRFVKDPVPVVTIEKFYFNQFTVIGSVKKPDRFALEFGDTVVDAIFRAGGLTFGRETGAPAPARFLKIYRLKYNSKERAELSLEQLVEKIKVGDEIQPREEIVLPLDDFLLGGNLTYNLPLAPSDIVFVPPAGAVYIHGRVRQAGVVFLGPSLRTVTQAVQERGGLVYSADNTIEVVRANRDGTTESYFFDIRRMLRREDPDFVLQDQDQVFVYRNGWRAFWEWFGDLFQASARGGINATYNPVA